MTLEEATAGGSANSVGMTTPNFAPSLLWRVELLGQLRASGAHRTDANVVTRFRRHKDGALLAYLAFTHTVGVRRERSHPREELIELLWPGCDPDAGRDRLSTTLTSLRRQLEPPGTAAGAVFITDRATVGLRAAAVSTDVAEFEAALESARRGRTHREQAHWLLGAVDLYRGELLPGYFEEWIIPERQRLAEAYLQALGQLIRHLEREGESERAIEYTRRVVALEPLEEEGQIELIRLLAAAGQTAAALRQYEEFEERLAAELGDEPSAAMQALRHQITRGRSASRIAGAEPPVPGGLESVPPRAPLPSESALLPPGTITFVLADVVAPLPDSSLPVGPLSPPVDPLVPLRREVERHHGQVLESASALLLAVFSRASDALAAAMAGQRMQSGWRPAAAGESSPTETIHGLRVALHTGEADHQAGSYGSPALDHLFRLHPAAHAGQVLLSEATAGLLRAEGEPGVALTDLGVYRLKDPAGGGAPPERLFHATGPDMPRLSFPPPLAEPFRQGQLPPPLTRFFGREEEIANLRRGLLEPSTRLVTLTGPGGSGKTRLALAVAEELKTAFRGAVWFVPLADRVEAGQIMDSVGAALGLDRTSAADPLEAVAQFLSEQPSLLVLDNFEQLVEPGASEVRRLLDSIPSFTCLVTSRQRLGLTGEREFVVHPLPVPYSPETIEETAQFPSVQLFVNRAQAVRPDFQVTRANAAALAELCRRLEGLPLALELAAARSSLLSPAQLLEQLTRRFELLVSRQRDAAPRHRSLRAALEWSYQLLPPDLQQFFARLSVFRGGWTLEAVQAVCGVPEALDYLELLRDNSLITVEVTEGEGRYRLLETLREYAWEQLEALGEQRELARRHAAFFLALAERADRAADGEDGADRLQEVEREYDNLRAALDGCLQSELPQDGAAMTEDVELRLALGAALGSFWITRCHYAEGRRYLTAVLARSEGNVSRARARALTIAGRLTQLQEGGSAASYRLLEEGLAMARALGDRPVAAETLLFILDQTPGHLTVEQRRALCEEALALCRELGDRRGTGVALITLGLNYYREDVRRARVFFEEGTLLLRQLGSSRALAWACLHLGNARYFVGEYELASEVARECLPLFGQYTDLVGLAACHELQRRIALAQDDLPNARRHAQLASDVDLEIGIQSGVARPSTWGIRLGEVELAGGDAAAAEALFLEGLDIARARNILPEVVDALAGLGGAALLRVDPAAAASRFVEGLSAKRAWHRPGHMLPCLEGLAGALILAAGPAGDPVAPATGPPLALGRAGARGNRVPAQRVMERAQGARLLRAARLLGAAEAMRERIGIQRPPREQSEHDDRIAALRASLADADFTAAWAAGRVFSLEETIACAMEGAPEINGA